MKKMSHKQKHSAVCRSNQMMSHTSTRHLESGVSHSPERRKLLPVRKNVSVPALYGPATTKPSMRKAEYQKNKSHPSPLLSFEERTFQQKHGCLFILPSPPKILLRNIKWRRILIIF